MELIVLWDGEATSWNTWDMLFPGVGCKGGAGLLFLDTRVETDCPSMGQHTETTMMDTIGEEINSQLVKYFHWG